MFINAGYLSGSNAMDSSLTLEAKGGGDKFTIAIEFYDVYIDYEFMVLFISKVSFIFRSWLLHSSVSRLLFY